MKKALGLAGKFIEYRISLKELYFSLSTWLILLIIFLGFTTKFNTTFLIVNLLIALYVYLIIMLITNRILLSGFLTLLLAVSFDYIKLIKWQFLMQEFSAADFFMLRLLINHGLFRLVYEYATKEIYLIFMLLIINFVLLWNKFDTFLDKSRLGSKNFYALRLVSFGVAILLSSKLFELSFSKNSYLHLAIESLKNDSRDYPRKIYGPFGDIVFTIQDIYIEPKFGKADENVILKLVEKDNKTINTSEEDMPDIIVILNESTFDPSKLDYDFADKLKFPFFQNGKYTKYSGTLNVNTFGGSSWISEYEINTGVPHKSFAGPSYMPFITLAGRTKNSIMTHLKSLGYRTEIIYPVDKNFSLAQDAYTTLGANNITDIYEYGFEPESWRRVPDKMIGEMILKALDDEPEKPKYIFAATMLNHGPHSSFFSDNIGCSLSMNDQLCSKLNDYMSRLSDTNTDQTQLIDKLMKRKKKTIIVNFGDHLPSFEGFSTQLRFIRDIKDYYKTFYNVNANFDVGNKEKYPALDISFIPSLLLDMAELNNNPFYMAGSYIRKNSGGQSDKYTGDSKFLESYKTLIVKQLGF